MGTFSKMMNTKMNINVVIILVLITIFNVYNTYGNENSIQPHNVDMRVKNFSGNMLNEKGIILKWSKVQKSKGYVIYRNSRKIATIKSNKIKKYTDKKVKSGKKYTYEIAPYKIINGKKVLVSKSYKIEVKATKRNTKKINPARVVIPDFYYKESYSVGLNESIKLHAKAKIKKGVKKKKVFNSKIVWNSSDESLATVDQNGVVKANNNRKTGTVYITARAINGVKKVIKVDVINYYNPLKFENYRVVPEELAPLFGKYKNEMCEIVTYFAFDNKISNVKIDLESDGLSVKTQPKIKLDEKIENALYTVMNELCLHFEIKDGYLKATYNDYFADGSIFKYNIICCIDKASEEKFQYQIGYVQIEKLWFYTEEKIFK